MLRRLLCGKGGSSGVGTPQPSSKGSNEQRIRTHERKGLLRVRPSIEPVDNSQPCYNRSRHYDHEPETQTAFDLTCSDHISRNEPGVFAPLRHASDQRRSLQAPRGPQILLPGAGTQLSLVCRTGRMAAESNPEHSEPYEAFERACTEYAHIIWRVEPWPIP